MSLIERALRDLVAEEVRRVVREERAALDGSVDTPEYLPVADAAARVAVAPATIRTWIAQGKLRRSVGREISDRAWSRPQRVLSIPLETRTLKSRQPDSVQPLRRNGRPSAS
jgi:hypothetical protein